jgi:hypothetical protein
MSKSYFLAVTLGGCASAQVDQTYKSGALPKPDMIIVRNFAVTDAEVQLDKGVMATAVRNAGDQSQSDEEVQVGHIISDKLAQKLVDELNKQGIPAVRDGLDVHPSNTTAIISGEFMRVDQGNQSARVWIGFGLGGSSVDTQVQVYQGSRLVAEGTTSTKASLKPGMVASVATGSVAGTVGASVAMGAAGAGLSETFMAGANEDASRTAVQIAKRIKQAYVERGWMAS